MMGQEWRKSLCNRTATLAQCKCHHLWWGACLWFVWCTHGPYRDAQSSGMSSLGKNSYILTLVLHTLAVDPQVMVQLA